MAAASELALDQVHQQEGEVVEHVAGGDRRIELDGVEQHRRVVDQDNISEMQIAVAAAHKAGLLARGEQRTQADKCCLRRAGERGNRACGKQFGRGAQFGIVLRGDVEEPIGEAELLHRRRRVMRLRDRACQRVGECCIDAALAGQPIERLALVETGHLHRPFHRHALAAEGQPPIGLPGDRRHAAID